MEEKLILYRVHKTDVIVNVRAEGGNVWLNRRQMAALFARDVKTIGKHISNALREELRDVPTVAYFATVQMEGERKITRQVEYYGLDMILSVGYRVKSAEGVHFRRWANEVLREHLLRGYTVNRKRMEQLGKILEIAERSAAPEIAGLASIVREYMPGLNKLDAYDRQTIPKAEGNKGGWILTYEEARAFIDQMRFGRESALFGREKDNSFKSALGAVYQTFDGDELYPGVQEKAARLLYLIVKNHAFVDGNKRIAAALFVWFLDRNKALRSRKTGRPFIDNNTLAAATLMLALSRPEEKELMCRLVMQMLEEPQ